MEFIGTTERKPNPVFLGAAYLVYVRFDETVTSCPLLPYVAGLQKQLITITTTCLLLGVTRIARIHSVPAIRYPWNDERGSDRLIQHLVVTLLCIGWICGAKSVGNFNFSYLGGHVLARLRSY